ncbi:hypothetical protein IP91_01654 [Pseudoduganella lurida]|uniref:Uncharacterized protein n=1 Tax=Pseudoduganella lurida TaxID=1036180 RepID=A0A562RGN2_9BURK|nr:hypothetical protein [Pseudoduganella lurida]TWI67540.1 hypothetical protein IP91_01654 [Pseudoduganella lurida]
MKPSTRAALVSALLFPGLGQLTVLKRPKRACLFLIPAAGALVFLLGAAFTAANDISAGILAGTIPLDPGAIAARIDATNKGDTGEIAAIVLLAAWLGSIGDALWHRP